jgi:transposase
MIQITPQMKVLVAIEPVDFRKGIDGLAQIVRTQLASDPFGGAAFLFRNRRGSAVKILIYDGQGFWLCHKRLSTGRFRFWPVSRDARWRALVAHQVAVLLAGGDFEKVQSPPPWREIRPVA